MVTKINQAAYYCDNVGVNMKKNLDISCALLELHVDVKENLYRIFYMDASNTVTVISLLVGFGYHHQYSRQHILFFSTGTILPVQEVV